MNYIGAPLVTICILVAHIIIITLALITNSYPVVFCFPFLNKTCNFATACFSLSKVFRVRSGLFFSADVDPLLNLSTSAYRLWAQWRL